ncbi:hypothetical protein [Clostridium carboxidivorans]|nr:hypothetical protein [Clostridium carboxidivorans]
MNTLLNILEVLALSVAIVSLMYRVTKLESIINELKKSKMNKF